MNRVAIAPSLLAADPLNLQKEIHDIEQYGIDFHHIDVMDGHFVPNLTFGPPLIRALKTITKVPLDVHIMVSNPDQVALDYVEAGADILVFHAEATVHHHRLLQMIKSRGAKAGIAINPTTPLESISPLLPYIDQINVMSVNPGFGGQSFIPETIGRLRQIKSMVSATGRAIDIEIDGGITNHNIRSVIDAGANLIVAGSYIYQSKNRKAAIDSLRC